MKANEARKPSFWAVVQAVAKVTFLEIVRDKVLYNVLLAAILLFGVGFLASRLSEMSAVRVILDFGLSALSISCLLVSVLVGAGMLGKEFERRTIHVALSHPINRLQFVVGKYVGLASVLFVNWFLMSVVYFALIFLQADSLNLSFTLGSAVLLVLLQTLVMAAVAVFFSSFSTTSLAVMFSLGIYLVGTNSSQIRLLAVRVKSEAGKALLNGIATFLPNLEHFNLGEKLTYDLPVTGQFVLTSVLYAVVVCSVCIVAAGLLVQAKEV